MNTPVSSHKKLSRQLLAAMVAAGLSGSTVFAQVDSAWNFDGAGIWGDEARWLNGDIADGAGATADFSTINITANRTVTLDTARTIGALLVGDSTGPSFSSYTIGATVGPVLTFDNGGTGAAITQRVDSGANTIAAPLSLADNLGVANNSTATLTLSGAVGAATAGTKTITNSGTGTGAVTISGVSGIIGNGGGTVAVVQQSATSALTLSGANDYTGGTTIKAGTVIANNTTALGTGAVYLGDTAGSADATLAVGSFTVANTITVQAGSTGKLSISNNNGSSARPAGDIVLNNALTVTADGSRAGSNQGALFSASGTIGGSGNLNVNVTGNISTSNNTNSPQMDSLSLTGPVTTTGEIHNVGVGSGRALISGAISNAASVNQDSATSMLSLSGTNTYAGNTNVNAGILRITTAAALPANNTVNVAAGGTFQLSNSNSTAFGAGSTINISGSGGVASHGAIETTNSSHYAGAVVLQNDATVASGLANTTLTLSGTITGPGRTLTVAGVGNTAIAAGIATGSGGLVKEGTATATLSAANSFTGATTLGRGVLALSHADALGGGGSITFNGGTLRLSSTNEADYGSRIVGSAGPVSLDTNGRNVTYSGIDASNTGGLAKSGSGRLTLDGVNSFSGPVVVNGGVLAVAAPSALPSGSGKIFLDSAGALNSGGAYANVQAWLDSGVISTGSTGVIALTGSSTENVNLTGYDNLGLGASASTIYTGTITPAGSTYRLGGGGGTLGLSGTNALTGANGLVVNGSVSITGSNNLSGPASVGSGTLAFGAAGTLANSAITVGGGGVLTVAATTSASPLTRADALELNRATLTVTGNTTANSNDVITGAFTVGSGGHSLVTLTPGGTRNTRLSAGSLVRAAGATGVIRGNGLGANTLASTTAGASNIAFSTAPTLLGGGGSNTTDRGIVAGLVGDTSAGGTGFAATGGLLTYDATNGLRLLGASEYKTSITSGQTQLDNVRLSSASGIATTTLAADTTINSLTIQTSGATSAGVSVAGAGKLTLNSGVIYSNSVTATAGSTISNAIDFGGREGIVLVGGSNNLTLSGALSNTGGNGLTVYAPSRGVTLSGATANTYTGTTTVNGGTLTLAKTAGLDAVTGDLLVNSGAAVVHSSSNQIADTANVTVNGGSLTYRTETINNLTLTNSGTAANANTNGLALTVNGALTIANDASLSTANATATTLTVGGVTNLSNGGSLNLGRSQSTSGAHDSIATLGGGLTITHKATGDYTAVTIGHGTGSGQAGSKLVLGGDVTFVGNATNTNTVLIDAIRGTGVQGVIALTTAAGNRTFDIGNGAASVDLRITAELQNGASVTSGLVKSGLGTLELSGANTYTGSTTINSGKLLLGASHRIADASNLVLNGGTFGTGGFSETLGTLGLGATSFIDFGSGSSSLVFADSSAVAWTGSVSLSLLNFTEGLDSIRIGTTSGGLTGFQLGQITINGLAAGIDANGYLFASAIPEPSAFAAFAGAAGLLAAATRRRRRSA